MDELVLARAQGACNLAGGLWPLLHVRSFEWVFGRKDDRWLELTVAGLLVVNGAAQLLAADTADAVAVARRLGVGTALTLLIVDLVNVPRRRVPPTYLLDAAVEAGWIVAWLRAARR